MKSIELENLSNRQKLNFGNELFIYSTRFAK